ncbi:MAG: arylesterase [Acidiferrobacterales bacterium]|nr:arylesterase [Acidiferrobacterales bacterium]
MNHSNAFERVLPNFRLYRLKMVAIIHQTIFLATAILLIGMMVSPSSAAVENEFDLSVLPDKEIRMLILGDSLSSGYGLQEAGWVELTNIAFKEAGKNIVIVNDSISGDTTAGGVARVEGSIERIRPDWVIIELGGNDGLRGLPPKVIEKNLTSMVERAQQAGAKTMLLGIKIPPNYGRSYTEKFEQVFVKVSKKTNSPLLPFFIGRVGGDPELNQSDMIHPNDAAQPIIRDLVLAFLIEVLSAE